MNKKLIQGITLIEVLLVMAIGAMILALGIQQYQLYKKDSEMEETKYNINTLFQAMARYYWANCNPPYSYNYTQSPCSMTNRSALVVCPATPTSNIDPVPINITTDLIDTGFLKLSDLTLQTIVDQKNQNDEDYLATNGYMLQFNFFKKTDGTIPNRQFCKNVNTCVTVAMIILWEMQIGVKLTLAASDNAANYANLLGAKCISDYGDQCADFPPAPPPNPGDPPAPPTPKYLIFSRYPVEAGQQAQSVFWPTNSIVREFKQQYEQQSDWYLATNPGNPAYYYCGH